MTDSLPRGSSTPLEWGHGEQNAPATGTLESYTSRALDGIEEEWQYKVCNLQMLVCELLLKNEQLRMSLGAKTAASQGQTGQGGG